MLISIYSELKYKKSRLAFIGAAGITMLLIQHQADVGFSVLFINYFFVLFLYLFTMDSPAAIKINYLFFKNKFLLILAVVVFIGFPVINITAEILEKKAFKYQEKSKFDEAYKLLAISTMILPENAEYQQRFGGCSRELFYQTGDVKYIKQAIDGFYKGCIHNEYYALFKINLAAMLIEFSYPYCNQYAEYYLEQALNVEPYNISLYLKAAEIMISVGNIKKALYYAKTGLIHEPYFLRLALICKEFDLVQSDFYEQRIKLIKNYGEQRIKTLNLKIFSSEDKEEIYYNDILHNSKYFQKTMN